MRSKNITTQDLEVLERFLASAEKERPKATKRQPHYARGLLGWVEEIREFDPSPDGLVSHLKVRAFYAARRDSRPPRPLTKPMTVKLGWLREVEEGASVASIAAREGLSTNAVRVHCIHARWHAVGVRWLELGGKTAAAEEGPSTWGVEDTQ